MTLEHLREQKLLALHLLHAAKSMLGSMQKAVGRFGAA